MMLEGPAAWRREHRCRQQQRRGNCRAFYNGVELTSTTISWECVPEPDEPGYPGPPIRNEVKTVHMTRTHPPAQPRRQRAEHSKETR